MTSPDWMGHKSEQALGDSQGQGSPSAAVHGVAESWIQLINRPTTSYYHEQTQLQLLHVYHMSGAVLTWMLSHVIITTTQDFGMARGKEAQQCPRLLHFIIKLITKLNLILGPMSSTASLSDHRLSLMINALTKPPDFLRSTTGVLFSCNATQPHK